MGSAVARVGRRRVRELLLVHLGDLRVHNTVSAVVCCVNSAASGRPCACAEGGVCSVRTCSPLVASSGFLSSLVRRYRGKRSEMPLLSETCGMFGHRVLLLGRCPFPADNRRFGAGGGVRPYESKRSFVVRAER